MNSILICPECKSPKLIKYGMKFHKDTDGNRSKRQQYLCKSCGRISVIPKKMPYRDEKGRFSSNGSL